MGAWSNEAEEEGIVSVSEEMVAGGREGGVSGLAEAMEEDGSVVAIEEEMEDGGWVGGSVMEETRKYNKPKL